MSLACAISILFIYAYSYLYYRILSCYMLSSYTCHILSSCTIHILHIHLYVLILSYTLCFRILSVLFLCWLKSSTLITYLYFSYYVNLYLIFHISRTSTRLILLPSYHILSYVFTYAFMYLSYHILSYVFTYAFMYLSYHILSYVFTYAFMYFLILYCHHVLFSRTVIMNFVHVLISYTVFMLYFSYYFHFHACKYQRSGYRKL